MPTTYTLTTPGGLTIKCASESEHKARIEMLRTSLLLLTGEYPEQPATSVRVDGPNGESWLYQNPSTRFTRVSSVARIINALADEAAKVS